MTVELWTVEPLLFILYISDLPHNINSKIVIIADDTTVHFHNKNEQRGYASTS